MPRNSAFQRFGILSLAVTTIVSAQSAPPAFASSDVDNPEQIALMVSEAASSVPTIPLVPDNGLVEVEIPIDPSGRIELSPTEGPGFAVTLPENVNLTAGIATADGTVVYPGRDGSAHVTVEALPDGARVTTIIESETEGRSFEYRLPENVDATPVSGGRLELTETVDVEAEGSTATVSVVVGYVEPAWAVDAAGNDVLTSYEVADGAITQHVETTNSTVYPVVADPSWTTTAWNQIRIRWNRAETATIAAGGWGATGTTAVCIAAGAAIGGPAGGAALGALCLTLTGSAVFTAGVAQNSSPKRCLEMFATYTFLVGPGGWVPWFGTYSGGTCR